MKKQRGHPGAIRRQRKQQKKLSKDEVDKFLKRHTDAAVKDLVALQIGRVILGFVNAKESQ